MVSNQIYATKWHMINIILLCFLNYLCLTSFHDKLVENDKKSSKWILDLHKVTDLSIKRASNIFFWRYFNNSTEIGQVWNYLSSYFYFFIQFRFRSILCLKKYPTNILVHLLTDPNEIIKIQFMYYSYSKDYFILFIQVIHRR